MENKRQERRQSVRLIIRLTIGAALIAVYCAGFYGMLYLAARSVM